MGVADTVWIRKPARAVWRGDRPHLRAMDPDELAAWTRAHLGGPTFRARQLFRWLHHARIRDAAQMTNLPAADRAHIAEQADLRPLELHDARRAADDTRKLLLVTPDGARVETVLIPNEGRGYTQCVSSMVGCSLSCRFCATATLGFTRSLAAWEIVDQVYRAQDLLAAEAGDDAPARVTNVVFMGMGEPLHNFAAVRRAIALLSHPEGAGIPGRRITVSTAGLVPGVERFAREGLGDQVGLAVSLNATTDEVRDRIMPINQRWPIADLLAAVRACPTPRRRRVTFEYVLLREVNDREEDARRLVRLLSDLRCQVNLIPFNPHPHAPYRRPAPAKVQAFAQILRARGLPVYVRTPRGDDIAAACGQLAAEETRS